VIGAPFDMNNIHHIGEINAFGENTGQADNGPHMSEK